MSGGSAAGRRFKWLKRLMLVTLSEAGVQQKIGICGAVRGDWIVFVATLHAHLSRA